jgi:DNA-directed RNA polymerase subunit L
MCDLYTGLDTGDIPATIAVSHSSGLITAFDFIIQSQDHTFGNMIQTWLVDNHVDGEASPRITFAGYKIPHPLKDEMLLRIGVEDGNELTARSAIAAAAKGCKAMFNEWLQLWVTGPKGAPITARANPSARAPIKLKRGTVAAPTSVAPV